MSLLELQKVQRFASLLFRFLPIIHDPNIDAPTVQHCQLLMTAQRPKTGQSVEFLYAFQLGVQALAASVARIFASQKLRGFSRFQPKEAAFGFRDSAS